MTIGIRTLPVRGIKPVDKKASLDDSWMSGMKSGTALFLLIKKRDQLKATKAAFL